MWTRMNDMDRLFGAMDRFRSGMDRVFRDFDRSYAGGQDLSVTAGIPRTNIYNQGNHFEIRAEVPGMKKDEISIKIQGNYLEISGSRKSDAPEAYKALRLERNAAEFTRGFRLPIDIDVEKIEASLNDGILSLILPKAEEAMPRQISVN